MSRRAVQAEPSSGGRLVLALAARCTRRVLVYLKAHSKDGEKGREAARRTCTGCGSGQLGRGLVVEIVVVVVVRVSSRRTERQREAVTKYTCPAWQGVQAAMPGLAPYCPYGHSRQ